MDKCALLHVEDEDASAYLFRAALDEIGAAVSVYRVSDGEQALAFLNRSGAYCDAETPSLVVLDLNLPRIDGWRVLARIQASEPLRDIPVVILSTSSLQEDKRKALAMGAKRYIEKPRDFEVLVQEVKFACMNYLSNAADSGR